MRYCLPIGTFRSGNIPDFLDETGQGKRVGSGEGRTNGSRRLLAGKAFMPQVLLKLLKRWIREESNGVERSRCWRPR